MPHNGKPVRSTGVKFAKRARSTGVKFAGTKGRNSRRPGVPPRRPKAHPGLARGRPDPLPRRSGVSAGKTKIGRRRGPISGTRNVPRTVPDRLNTKPSISGGIKRVGGTKPKIQPRLSTGIPIPRRK